MRKILCMLISFVIIFTLTACTKDENDFKTEIFAFVENSQQDIFDAVAELKILSENIYLEEGEYISGVGNAELDGYVEDVNGLYLYIDKPDTVGRRFEVENEVLKGFLNGEPVEYIYVKDELFTFDCGGTGIVPSSQYYSFYYSDTDDLLAVDCGQVLCDSEDMKPDGEGFIYTDNSYNTFYTEKITDNFYYCKSAY